MQKLIQGLHQFQRDIFGPRKGFFEKLAKGQNPDTLFITCADSRINPNLITQTGPGDLFIVRNVGNMVAPYNPGQLANAEAAAIEYAVDALKVKDIVICGHSHCGAMKAVIGQADVSELPSVAAWLKHADATRRIIQQNYQHLQGNALLTAAVQENVLVQLDQLRTLPTVAAALSRKAIQLHAWVYKIESGEVFHYDPDDRQYLPLGEGTPNPELRAAAAAAVSSTAEMVSP